MPTPSGLRATRCGAFAVSAALLAVGGHLAGGGHLPAPGALGAAVLACAATGWWLARVRRAPLTVLAGLVVLQLALHRFFEAWPHGAVPPVHPMPMPMPMAGMEAMPHHPAASGSPLWMLLGHAGSVLITGLLLGWGERALWILLGLLSLLLPVLRLRAAAPLVVPAGRPVPYRPVPRPRPVDATAPLRRRGPPVGVPVP